MAMAVVVKVIITMDAKMETRMFVMRLAFQDIGNTYKWWREGLGTACLPFVLLPLQARAPAET